MADANTPVTGAPGTPVAGQGVSIKTLNQQDFLRLLVAQLPQPDPLNPKSDLERIAIFSQALGGGLVPELYDQ